ncbi:MAG: hypothetical protein HC809_11370 [Gammaproteobacteria bacterium]|nr:hypothetical protein [Gammaproteobacteria bacterium]
MMPRLVNLFVFGMLAVPVAAAVASAASPPSPPCSGADYRSFDFWVGEWTVRDADGTHVGDNSITREEAGCLIAERWRSLRGGTGRSMNFFDSSRGKWRQLWVSPGSRIEIEGGFIGDYMILEGTITYIASGESYPFRGTWNALPDGRVRQYFEESRNAGVWAAWFEGFYSRSAPRREPGARPRQAGVSLISSEVLSGEPGRGRTGYTTSNDQSIQRRKVRATPCL